MRIGRLTILAASVLATVASVAIISTWAQNSQYTEWPTSMRFRPVNPFVQFVGTLFYQNVAGQNNFGWTDGSASTGTQLRSSQATAPTCTNNCGSASPTVTGSDSFMTVNLGTSPASPFTVTFNGTWAAAPACVATAFTTAANYVQKAPTTTTTVIVTTAAGPSTGDKYMIICGATQ